MFSSVTFRNKAANTYIQEGCLSDQYIFGDVDKIYCQLLHLSPSVATFHYLNHSQYKNLKKKDRFLYKPIL